MMRFFVYCVCLVHVMAGKALLDVCTDSSECISDLCTGRPGKPKKCRFCARKQEICTRDDQCCQARQFPSRYCDNGYCKKRSLPVVLAYASFTFAGSDAFGQDTYSVIDTKTFSSTILKSAFNPSGDDELSYTSEMEYDRTTGILWTSSYNKLFKRDAFFTVTEEFSLESQVTAMEVVEEELYAVMSSGNDNSLVTINKNNGIPTTIGPVTGADDESPQISGLAYDGTAMYALTANPSLLVKIDVGSGNITSSVTLIEWIDGYDYDLTNCYGLDFGPDGTLYTRRYRDGLYSINKVTGVADVISYETGLTAFTVAY